MKPKPGLSAVREEESFQNMMGSPKAGSGLMHTESMTSVAQERVLDELVRVMPH